VAISWTRKSASRKEKYAAKMLGGGGRKVTCVIHEGRAKRGDSRYLAGKKKKEGPVAQDHDEGKRRNSLPQLTFERKERQGGDIRKGGVARHLLPREGG